METVRVPAIKVVSNDDMDGAPRDADVHGLTAPLRPDTFSIKQQSDNGSTADLVRVPAINNNEEKLQIDRAANNNPAVERDQQSPKCHQCTEWHDGHCKPSSAIAQQATVIAPEWQPRYTVQMLIPIFYGSSDPLPWVSSMEILFRLYHLTAEQQVPYAALHLSGPAFDWFMRISTDNILANWENFSELLRLEFTPQLNADEKIWVALEPEIEILGDAQRPIILAMEAPGIVLPSLDIQTPDLLAQLRQAAWEDDAMHVIADTLAESSSSMHGGP